MDWRVKAAAFRLLSAMPFGSALLLQLQRRVTREVPRREPALHALLLAARRIQELYLEQVPPGSPSDRPFVEIGAGRDLAVALALRMLGIKKITCVDVSRLARLDLVQHAASYMAHALNHEEPSFRSWADVEAFGICYHAPAAFEDMTGQAQTFACFYSTEVLEHIPPEGLGSVLAHARNLLTADGVSIHSIDYSDHYARSDRNLSRFNFLRFSSAAWQNYNPDLHYVNRMRHSELVRCFVNAGFEIIFNQTTVTEPEEDILQDLAEEFKSFSIEDLFTQRSWIVGRAATAAA